MVDVPYVPISGFFDGVCATKFVTLQRYRSSALVGDGIAATKGNVHSSGNSRIVDLHIFCGTM